jgi:hypothetical protein
MSRTGPKISWVREALQNFQQAIRIDERVCHGLWHVRVFVSLPKGKRLGDRSWAGNC